MFPLWLKAGFWGLVGGSALLMGSAVGYYAKIPKRAMSSDKPLHVYAVGALLVCMDLKTMQTSVLSRIQIS
jgi:ZIP family zinc transporter